MGLIKLEYVIRFSSEDDIFKAENMLRKPGFKPWLCSPDDKSGHLEAEFQLERSSCIEFIDIGNLGSSNVEILVGRSEMLKKTTYKTLLPAVSLLTLADLKAGTAMNSVYMFNKNNLNELLAEEKWDRIKVVCSQPFKKNMQFGLSFISLRSSMSFKNLNISTDDETADNERPSKCLSKKSSSSPSFASVLTRGEKLLNASKSRRFLLKQKKKIVKRIEKVMSYPSRPPLPLVSSPPSTSPQIIRMISPPSTPPQSGIIQSPLSPPLVVDSPIPSPPLEMVESPIPSPPLEMVESPIPSPPFEIVRYPQPSESLEMFRESVLNFLIMCYEEDKLIHRSKYYMEHFARQRHQDLTTQEKHNFNDCYFQIVCNNRESYSFEDECNNNFQPSSQINKSLINSFEEFISFDETVPVSKKRNNQFDLTNTIKKTPMHITTTSPKKKTLVISVEDFSQPDGITPSTSSGIIASSPPTPCGQCPSCGEYFTLDIIEVHAWSCGEVPEVTEHDYAVDISSTARMHDSDVEDEDKNMPCPLCMLSFPKSELAEHTANCPFLIKYK